MQFWVVFQAFVYNPKWNILYNLRYWDICFSPIFLVPVQSELCCICFVLLCHIHLMHSLCEVKWKSLSRVFTLCDPVDYTVHGILQPRILEWVAFPFSRGSSQTQGSNPGLPHCRRILYQLSHKTFSLIALKCKPQGV